MLNSTHRELMRIMDVLLDGYQELGIRQWSVEQYVWCVRELFRGEGVADAFYHHHCNVDRPGYTHRPIEAIDKRVDCLLNHKVSPVEMVKKYYELPFLKAHIVGMGLLYRQRLAAQINTLRCELPEMSEGERQKVISTWNADCYAKSGLVMVDTISALHFMEGICFDQLIDPVFADELSFERYREVRAVLTLALNTIS